MNDQLNSNLRTLDFYFPDSWQDLSELQLKYVFKLLATNLSLEEIKLFCLFRWNNVSVLARKGDGSYMLSVRKSKSKSHNSNLYEISPLKIAEIFSFMDWMDDMPDYPVRINRIGLYKALPADFLEVPIEKFIMADNFYQMYVNSRDDSFLEDLFFVLYSSPLDIPAFKLRPWQRINCFYWFGALKTFFSRQFPDFFQPAKSQDALGSSFNDQMESMNAMIRALTKGDITKEKKVLAMDTWRALSELNAQAREYREFNAKYKK